MNRTESLREIGLFFRLDKKIAPLFIIFGIVLIVGFVSGAFQLFGIIEKYLQELEKCGK